MGITTAAGDGVRVTSSAKNNGALVGSYSPDGALPDNQFVLPDSLAATNNGQITLATIAGRLIVIRRNEVNEETRYITAEHSLVTGTMNEAWDDPPASGSAYDIAYVVEDAAALTGFSLITKRTRDYSLGRLFSVGNDTTGTFSWFALLDGASIESDNNITPPEAGFEIDGDGRWDFGYEQGGAAVPGGYLISTANATADFAFRVRAGGQLRSYDLFLTSVENNIIDVVNESRVIVNGLKVYKALYQSVWEASGLMEDLVLVGVNDTNDRIELDESFDVDGLLLINSNGFYPNGLTTGSVLNYQSVGNLQDIVYLTEGSNVIFLNPIWDGLYPDINWGSISTGTLEERFEYLNTVSSPAGVPRPDARIYVHDALFNDFQIQTPEGTTSATGVFNDDILARVWASGTADDNPEVRGSFTQRILRFGQAPFEAALSVSARIAQTVTLVDDAGVELSEASADAVTGTYVTEHSPPATLLGYDAGTSLFVAGEIVSGTTSLAVGTVIEVEGDATIGTLFMGTRNGTAFVDDESLVGNSGGAADADAASVNLDFTWEVGGGGSVGTTLADLYSWLASKTAKLNLEFSWIIEMLRHRVQLVLRSGDNYSTERVDNEGVFISDRGAGTVTQMTADNGSTFTPPATVTFTLSNLIAGSEVRIYEDDGGGEAGAELAGTENSGTSFPYTYTYGGSDIPVVYVVLHIDYGYIRRTISLGSSDNTLPIDQASDRVYSNP